jgi:hypothetical protein
VKCNIIVVINVKLVDIRYVPFLFGTTAHSGLWPPHSRGF